jgi:hypothetical protein
MRRPAHGPLDFDWICEVLTRLGTAVGRPVGSGSRGAVMDTAASAIDRYSGRENNASGEWPRRASAPIDSTRSRMSSRRFKTSDALQPQT